jgi:dihydropyrimidinase
MLIRGGDVVLPDRVVRADVLIVDGVIAAVGRDLEPADGDVVDAGGLVVLPGAIDPHVHFGWPGAADGFAEGSVAAACGGVTTVLEFAVQFPGEDILSAVAGWREQASDSVLDFGFHVVASDATPSTLDGLRWLAGQGVTSVKMFMTSRHSGGLGIGDGEMFAIMETVAGYGGLAMAHCENDSLIELLSGRLVAAGNTAAGYHRQARPDYVEAEAIGRAIRLAGAAGAAFYVPHLSSAAGLDTVRAARSAGAPVLAETCPQFLALTDEVYTRPDAARWVMSPPIKSAADQEALWAGLLDGSLVTVGSDHCPYPDGAKAEHAHDDFRLVPNGVPGVETLLPLLHHFGVAQGRFGLVDLARITATNPARVFGLTTKGAIVPGLDGDLALLDPAGTLTLAPEALHSAIDYSIFPDVTVTGRPVATVAGGRLVARDGRWTGPAGGGRFLPRRPVPPAAWPGVAR